MPPLLRIALDFPNGYGGAAEGDPEPVPSFSRVHEALLGAAAGGPRAVVDGRVLEAIDEDREALAWLEDHEPLGLEVPPHRLSRPIPTRYRWRASPRDAPRTGPSASPFESRSAILGSVAYYWPAPGATSVEALRAIAGEVTHVGRADSVVRVAVDVVDEPHGSEAYHAMAVGRGPGRVLSVPQPGRLAALEEAHREASRPGSHGTGPLGKQAPDHLVTGANVTDVLERRFVPAASGIDWPFAEVLLVNVGAERTAGRLLSPTRRIGAAVGIHRALVREIGTDVPPFVTGRDGSGPLRGAGHLAIHVLPDRESGRTVAALAVPTGVLAADRARLLAALDARPRARVPGLGHVTLGRPSWRSAHDYWDASEGSAARLQTPMVLDAPGVPRRAPWSLEDAVVASVGFAFRGVLERAGLEWGRGWGFRRSLVDRLRDEWGVDATARRVHRSASRYVHRAGPGDLLVAADARVELGRLASPRGGFVALGRARHLGGGLLVPQEAAS